MNSMDSINVTSSPVSVSGLLPCGGQDLNTSPESGQALVLVNRSVARGPEKAQPTNATFGRYSQTLFELADPPSRSASKSQVPQLSERLGAALKIRLSRYGSMECLTI